MAAQEEPTLEHQVGITNAQENNSAKVHYPEAAAMKTPRTIDDIMNEMNAQAKAQGRFLGKAFREIPPMEGSILDIAQTPESERQIAVLRERRLKRKLAAKSHATLGKSASEAESFNQQDQCEDSGTRPNPS